MENKKNYMLNYSKVKLLFLKDLLIQETDSEHGLTMKEIQTRIDHQYQTKPDRKTIIKDIDALEDYGGIEIQRPSGRRMDYRVLKGGNDLDLMEIKLLIDTVQASRFLSQKQSDALVRKLEYLCSKHEKKKLYHKVIVPNRAKSTNRQILYVMDSIHEAIESNKQIRFQYYTYDIEKKKKYHHDGGEYRVSPFALLYHKNIYTLIAIPAKDTRIRLYRVDRMENVTISHADRHQHEVFNKLNLEELSNGTFGLTYKHQCIVTLNAHISLIDDILDRFGKEITFSQVTKDIISFSVPVTISPEFFGWVMSFSGRMKISAPYIVQDDFRRACMRVASRNPRYYKSRYNYLY